MKFISLHCVTHTELESENIDNKYSLHQYIIDISDSEL